MAVIDVLLNCHGRYRAHAAIEFAATPKCLVLSHRTMFFSEFVRTAPFENLQGFCNGHRRRIARKTVYVILLDAQFVNFDVVALRHFPHDCLHFPNIVREAKHRVAVFGRPGKVKAVLPDCVRTSI